MSLDNKAIASSDQNNPSPQLMLVLGGARSGKSTFVERLATHSGRSVVYIATATALDDDMRDRIAHHRSARPKDWLTIEEPLKLAEAVHQAAQGADVLILDCMTLWLSNWLGQQPGIEDEASLLLESTWSATVMSEIELLLAEVKELTPGKTLLVVSNEVGLGIVPAYPLGRVYRDLLGRVNQRLAQTADRVYLLVAGIAVDIKRLQEEIRL